MYITLSKSEIPPTNHAFHCYVFYLYRSTRTSIHSYMRAFLHRLSDLNYNINQVAECNQTTYLQMGWKGGKFERKNPKKAWFLAPYLEQFVQGTPCCIKYTVSVATKRSSTENSHRCGLPETLAMVMLENAARYHAKFSRLIETMFEGIKGGSVWVDVRGGGILRGVALLAWRNIRESNVS